MTEQQLHVAQMMLNTSSMSLDEYSYILGQNAALTHGSSSQWQLPLMLRFDFNQYEMLYVYPGLGRGRDVILFVSRVGARLKHVIAGFVNIAQRPNYPTVHLYWYGHRIRLYRGWPVVSDLIALSRTIRNAPHHQQIIDEIFPISESGWYALAARIVEPEKPAVTQKKLRSYQRALTQIRHDLVNALGKDMASYIRAFL